MKKPRTSVILALLAATLFWGGHYALSFIALKAISPLGLVWWRWTIAVIPLFIIAQIVEHPHWHEVLHHLPHLIMLSVLGVMAYNLLLYYALHFTTGVGASVINAANPALIAVMAAILVKTSISRQQWTGIVISLFGVLVVLSKGSWETFAHMRFNTGQLLVLGAILAWSIYTIYSRVPGIPPIASTAIQALIVVVVLAPFAIWQKAGLPWGDPAAMAVILYIALFPSVASYVCWNLGTRSVAPASAGIFLNLVTVFAAIIGTFIGQPPTVWDLIGGIVIIAGVVLTTMPSRYTHVSKEPANTLTSNGDSARDTKAHHVEHK